MSVLISYSYFEPDDKKSAQRYQRNLKFFLKEGVEKFQKLPNIHQFKTCVLVQGGKCGVKELSDDIRINSENTGFDLGAHYKVIQKLDPEISKYDYYIFLNCGQRGPFLPTFWNSEQDHWSKVFINQFEKQKSKPGGVSASMFFHPKIKRPILETWAFALPRNVLRDVWKSTSVFSIHKTKENAIVQGEDTLGPYLYNHGYELGCLLYKYRDRDWLKVKDISEDVIEGDIPSRPFAYEGINIHPLEVVFYKTFWKTSAYDDENEYICPFEEKYTQWVLNEKDAERDDDGLSTAAAERHKKLSAKSTELWILVLAVALLCFFMIPVAFLI